jgi:DNA-binding GntR family transcriptional regulator
MDDGIHALKPVDRETLKSKVYKILREAIQSGALKPDQRLIEEDISSRLGVSRVPVREAIAFLEQDGLVVRELGRGASVANPSEKDVEEIYGLRIALELHALATIMETISEEDLQLLQEKVSRMSECIQSEDILGLVEIDLSFHESLLMMTGNQRLLDAWKSQIVQLRMLLALSGSAGYDVRQMVKGHQQIIVALREGNLQTAQRTLGDHIGMSRDRLLRQRNVADNELSLTG